MEEAASGTESVAENIDSVTRAANRTGDAAHEMLNAADDLNKQSEELRTHIRDFLQDILKKLGRIRDFEEKGRLGWAALF